MTHVEQGADAADIERRVFRLIRRFEPDATDIQIRELHRLSSGYARENWSFQAFWRKGVQEHEAGLIVRRDPVTSLLETEREVEFAILQALEAVPHVKAPRARWVDGSGSTMGTPALVMDRILEGDCDWFLLNGDLPLDQRLQFAHRYVEHLSNLHQPPVLDAVTSALPDIPDDPGRYEVQRWTETLRRYQLEPYPELEYMRQWLLLHVPAPGPLALVHGDFKPGNMLTTGPVIHALLDWETAHIGDPIEDLGWITNPLRRAEQQIAGVWTAKHAVAYYEQVTKTVVETDRLRFWQVFANYKLAVIAVTGLHAFIHQEESRVFWGPEEVLVPAFQLMGES